MHEAWELLAQIDGDYGPLIDDVLLIVAGVRERLEMRAGYQEWRSEIAEAAIITDQFIVMCGALPVLRAPTQGRKWDDDPLETIGKRYPDFLVRAKEIYLELASEAFDVREEERDEVGDLSRKFGDGRADMARDFCHIIKHHTGAPHYEAVAALLNTILDTDEITADAVRKMISRAADRTIRSQK
jgi:hypothetical protein